MTKVEVVRLGTYPTPVEQIEGRSLWVKRDDLTSALYGGNKVRKLEYLLADAGAAGKRRLVTLGAAGSHQILATALFGRSLGFEVEAVVVPQPASPHAVETLRAAVALGVTTTVASTWAMAPAMALSRLGRDSYLVPLGGSSPLGCRGYVEAAKELAAQVEVGLLPEPDVIVVGAGSAGTAAGLAVGLETTALRTRVVAVAISPPVAVVGVMARRLAKKTAELVGLSRASAERAVLRIDVDKRWLGRGYGFATAQGVEATRIAREHAGLELDPAYTSKAFAAALELAASRGTTLYWHTLSSAPHPHLGAELPSDLARLFRSHSVVPGMSS
jgi:1-aminocyclopropane-1-carboxylate deaminase/D-cysteine desulfhydrase-like pyridoxal-dependent ACC family enzyme